MNRIVYFVDCLLKWHMRIQCLVCRRFINQVEFEETLGGMVEAMTEIQGRADGMMAEIRTREVSECIEPLPDMATRTCWTSLAGSWNGQLVSWRRCEGWGRCWSRGGGGYRCRGVLRGGLLV